MTLAKIFHSALIITLCTLLNSTKTSAADTLNYRLKWLRNVSVVGALYAENNQLFAKAGLNVVVKPGGPERDAIRELELGRADFGVASADQVLRARAKGAPIVVIAQLFQINPLQWVYRPEGLQLQSLADLRGKVVGVTFGGNDESIMRTLLTKAKLSDSEVRLFSVRYDYTPFYRKRVQLWPYTAMRKGRLLPRNWLRREKKLHFSTLPTLG